MTPAPINELTRLKAIAILADAVLNDLRMAWGNHYPGSEVIWALDKELAKYAEDRKKESA